MSAAAFGNLVELAAFHQRLDDHIIFAAQVGEGEIGEFDAQLGDFVERRARRIFRTTASNYRQWPPDPMLVKQIRSHYRVPPRSPPSDAAVEADFSVNPCA